MSFKKNTAVTGFPFALIDASDGSAITSGTVTGYYLLDGGTQGTIAGTPVHEGNGQWSVDLTAAEMNGDIVGLLFTHSSAINAHFTIKTDTKLVSELNDPSAVNVRTEMDSNSTQLAAIVADTGTDGVVIANGAVTAAVIATAAIDADAIAAGAITAAKIGVDAIGAQELAADAIAEIVDAVWDEDIIAAHNTADTAGAILDDLDTPADFKADVSNLDATVSSRSSHNAAAVRTEMDSNSTQLAAIVADTNELQADDVPGLIAALNDPTPAAIADAVWDELSAGHVDAGKAGEQLWTDLDAVLADTGTDGVLLANDAITAAKIADDAITSDQLHTTALQEIADTVWDEPTTGHFTAGTFGQRLYVVRQATAQAGATGSITLDVGASAVDDLYDGQLIFITAGTGAGQSRRIDTYTGSTKVATVNPNWATTPSSDSVFVIVPEGDVPGASAPTAAQVADAVWDEALADHDTEDSLGNVLNDLTEESAGTYRFTSAALQSTLGAGAIPFTYTLTSTVDASPIPDADVWVSTDLGCTNVVASGRTDDNGQVVFYLDTATYYFWRQKSGWNFPNPDIEAVS